MNIRFRKVLFLLGTLLLVAAYSTTAFAQQAVTKVAYVDLQRALLEVEDGKKAKARLKKEFDAKQKQLDKKQDQVKKMKEELEAQAMMLSDDAKRQKAMELQKQMYELQQLYLALQQDLSQKEAQATKKIFDRMGELIEQIGKDQKIDLILEKSESSVLYARSGMDITAELIKRYNASK